MLRISGKQGVQPVIIACRKEKCSSKRSRKEEQDSGEQALRHLLQLDTEKQNSIANKYYRGIKPWLETNK